MGLDIRLLGPPRVGRDGAVVTFETRKATALLAHLALSDRPRSREALCELLYPGHDPERARGALRRTLSTLRTGIGAERLDTSGAGIGLGRGRGVTVDVEQFRSLSGPDAPPEDLAEALELFGGRFLEGFSLRDSPDFDDWQMGVAGVLDRELASALRRLVEHLVAAGDLERALPLARRWLELDPLHEPAHRELMRLHSWCGDRAAALEQYRSCVRVMSDELGVAPVAETTALFEEIYDGTLAEPARGAQLVEPDPAAPRLKATVLPLVGRGSEMKTLLDARTAATPDGAVAVIEGEAGIGKSRLADELAQQARSAGGVVLVAHCHDDEAGLPYGPVVELLRRALQLDDAAKRLADVSDQNLADASLLLPELATLRPGLPAPLPLEGPGGQVRLFDGVSAVVAAACRGASPGVVILDDAHAADEATLDAIAYLGRRLQDRPMLLVVAWRSEAVPPGHRLRRLAHEGRTTIVSPSRLDEGEVAELTRSSVASGGTPDVERRVFVESEGLPLFVAEYLAALAAGEPVEGVLTEELRGLLDRRLAGLDDVARQVLGAAAAIGRSFDFDTVRQASGRSDEESVDALEDLVACGVVRESKRAEPTYDFSHSKIRELVYEQMGLARRRLLHGRIAAALPGPPGLVATHLGLAGNQVGAAEQHRLAADQAISVHAHADALEHLEAALALGIPDAAVAHEGIGDLKTLLGDYVGALASYEAATVFGTPDGRAAIEHKAGEVHQRRGEWERAEARFTAALEAAPAEASGLRARIVADLALTMHHAGRQEHATELVHEALGLAETAGDRLAEAQAHNILGVIARSTGDVDSAHQHLRRSLDLARELGDGPAEAAALNNLALVERDAGVFTEAIELTGQALALCSVYGDRHREAALENNLADLLHAAGKDDEAMIHLKRAVSLFSEVGADEATRLPEIWKLVSW